MKYEYITATGKTEIELNEQFYEILITLDKEEYNSDRKHSRRNPQSLEDADYEGEWFSDNTDLLGDLIRTESCERLNKAILQLTASQQVLIQQIYFEGALPSEIAKQEGVDKSAISHRLNRIHKRLKNILD